MYPYQCYRDAAESLGLPRWLTPPKILRDAVSKIFKEAKVTVQTPAGPVEMTPAEAARYAAQLKLNVSIGGRSKSASDNLPAQIADKVQRIPGGWLTVAGGAVLLGLVIVNASRGRK
jgi:hypothetical protein